MVIQLLQFAYSSLALLSSVNSTHLHDHATVNGCSDSSFTWKRRGNDWTFNPHQRNSGKQYRPYIYVTTVMWLGPCTHRGPVGCQGDSHLVRPALVSSSSVGDDFGGGGQDSCKWYCQYYWFWSQWRVHNLNRRVVTLSSHSLSDRVNIC